MNKVLLVGDTHPEMIAIANRLAIESVNYHIVLPTYFTFSESSLITRLRFVRSKYHPWLLKRTLNSRITKDSLKRTCASLELISWILKNRGFHKLSWKFLRYYHFFRRRKIPGLISSIQPNLIVTYDTMILPRNLKQEIIVICPMSHPASVKRDLGLARDKFPNWPEMDDEAPLGDNETALSAKRILVLSEFAKQSYIDQGFQASEIDVLHIGPINGNRASTYEPNYISGNKLHILFLGRMTRIKGIEAIMQVSKLLDPCDFRISLVGQCSPDIARYIRENSNSTILQLIPNPKPDDIEVYFREAHIFVLPSFNEGFNIASLEAMTFGLIPILSHKSGVSEILKGTKFENLTIEPGDVEQLYSKLLFLKEQTPIAISQFQELSFEISQKYSFDKFASEFFRIFIKDMAS